MGVRARGGRARSEQRRAKDILQEVGGPGIPSAMVAASRGGEFSSQTAHARNALVFTIVRPEPNTVTVVGTNGEIIRTTRFPNDHVDYSWLLLSVLAVALIAAGLRKLFWRRDSN